LPAETEVLQLTDSGSFYTEEIDIRELILSLWKSKILIVSVTVLASAITFAVCSFLVPRRYRAIAYVAIRQPIVLFSNNSGISIKPDVPDIQAASQLAMSDGLFNEVETDPSVAGFITSGNPHLHDIAEVEVVAEGQLNLQVTDMNPDRAASLANAWARHLVDRLNNNYGTAAVTQSLESQVERAKDEYGRAQAAWGQALAENQESLLSAFLSDDQDQLKCALATTSSLDRALEDIRLLRQRIAGMASDSLVSTQYALDFNSIQHKTLGSEICGNPASQNVIVQISSDDLRMSVGEALGGLDRIERTAHDLRQAVESRQVNLQAEIPRLEGEVAKAQNQLDELQIAQQQAKDLYESLAQQQKQLSSMKNGTVASLSQQAIAPQNPSSPRVLVNTLLAAVISFAFVIAWVWARAWWGSGNIQGTEHR
jgi:uncharacterized protein involved in exopolysaccharide biosynthesis